MLDRNSIFFELPSDERPTPHFLHQYWYPGVEKTWSYSTSSRIYDPLFGVKAIAIHATAGNSTYGAMSVMKGGNASWHWLVPDENEKAHRKFAWACAPESRAAWHIRNAVSHPYINSGANKINHWSLGIEIVNNQANSDTFSDWQLEMTAKIVRYAWAKYPNLQYVISHAMMDPYRRSDPGKNFDWGKFEQLVITGPARSSAAEFAFLEPDFGDIRHLDDLETDYSDSICGNAHRSGTSPRAETAFSGQGLAIDWNISVNLAEASQIAYGDEEQVLSWAQNNLSATQVEFIDKGDTELFIAENDNEVFIVFRGSMGVEDWIANMKIRKSKTGYGKFHGGFLKGFSGVREQVFAAMTRARVYNKKIFLAGHSLGGALAMIAAADSEFHIGQTPIHGIYTYGMPKACNRKSANFINSIFGSRFFRFVNDRDIVTRIPPGSRHAGRLIHFDKNGEIKNKPETAALMKTVDDDITEEQFLLMQKGLKRKKQNAAEGQMIGADDHSISEYINILRKHRDR